MRKCEVRSVKMNKKLRSNLITYGIVVVAFLLCQTAINGWVPGFTMSNALQGQLIPICVYIVMAVSLNLTVGISGELSLGHAGFMCVGTFAGIIMSSWLKIAFQVDNELVRLLMALITGGVFAGLAGVLVGIPVLRLRGDYLAIVTLAFGEIIRSVLNCLYFSVEGKALRVSFDNPNLAGQIIYSGPAGATEIDTISTFTMGFILVMFTLFVVLNLVNSRSGRAIMAIRDSRIAAESVGLNVTKYKMMAFVTSAVLAGMAGALYGLSLPTATAAKFKFDTSILVLVFVVLGGIGSIRGSVIAAAVLTLLPEMLRGLRDYRMLIYAIVLIVVMLLRNSNVVKNLLGSIRSIRTISDLTTKTGEMRQQRRIASLQAKASRMGVRAQNAAKLAEDLALRQKALEAQIIEEMQKTGKEADAQ